MSLIDHDVAFPLVIILINDVLKNGGRKMLPTSECL